MKLAVVGKGVFGTFIEQELSQFVTLVEPHEADALVLAVPFNAYEDVASRYSGKHLVNVCSVQEKTNEICLKNSDKVTGVHPLFGPRSGKDGRVSLVTLETVASREILDLFSQVSRLVSKMNGVTLTGAVHDAIMAKTHKKVVEISATILEIVDGAKDIPDELPERRLVGNT